MRPRREATAAGHGELSASAHCRSGAHKGRRLSSVTAKGRLMDTPRLLLEHYLKQLRLPTMLREFPKLGEQCAKEGATFEQFLLRLVEQELMDRERRARTKDPRSPVSRQQESGDI